jgi:glycosyltransferase involved in cell wall biosynthesis
VTGPVEVLHVRNCHQFGGPETTLLGWLDHLDRTRFTNRVALFQEREGREEAFRGPLLAHGHPVIDLPWWPGRTVRKAVRRLEEHIRSTGAKILHTHDWRSDVIGYHAARRAGIPVVTTVYVWFHRPFHVWVKETVDTLYIRHFDMVTAVCEATRRQTVARGVRADRTEVLISGISPARQGPVHDRNAVRKRFGIAPDEVALVFAARMSPEKAHHNLLSAFAMAVRRAPNLKLILLGNGPLEGEIRAWVARLGLSDRVAMPGFVTDVTDILAAMDVDVHATLAEGIPLAVYEAMLVGLPVIGSDVDGIPEVVIPGRTGWLVPPSDPAALAERIVEASGSAELRAHHGAEARRLIQGSYGMDKAVERLHSTYDRLLQRSAASARASPP